MQNGGTRKPIVSKLTACIMSVVLALGMTPTPGFAATSDNESIGLIAAAPEPDLANQPDITSWSALQERINSVADGSTIQLTRSLTAAAGDSCLVIPWGRKITIDLAGRTLNRGLANSDAADDGAVIQVGRDAELTLINTSTSEATITGGNNSHDGGGIFNQGILMIGGNDDPAAIHIRGNKADYGAGIYSAGTTEINGAIMHNNEAGGSGGAIYNYDGELTVTNGSIYSNSADVSGGGIFNSGGTATLDGTVISNCSAKENGGGICSSGTLMIEYGEILGNHAETGGGIYVVSKGNVTIEDGVMSRNSATEDGGGIYVESTGTLTLGYSPSINTNTAGANYHGGGIYDRGNLVLTGGRPTVSNNKRGSWAENIYLPGSKKIEVAGHLSGGKLAVTLEGGIGQVTQGFGAQGNATVTSFKGDNLYAAVNNGEVWLQAEEQQQVFMDPNQYPIKQYPKPSEVGATNWMAAIPDDWLISEFNIPYSHDSATKNISPYNVIGNTGVQLIKGRGWSFAVTQVHTIPEQLNMGVRCLDVRLNNEYPYNGTTISADKADDGDSLWICHGKSKSGGTYYAYDDDGSRISFEKVLNYAKSFLTDHPTETITILLTAETQWPKENSPKIWARARAHLEALSTTINPSTGKSFLYREEGQGFFNTYNHFPRLGDCRGQIVVQYDSSYEYSEEAHLYVGGMQGLRDVDSQWPNGVTWKREKGGNGVSASDKIDNINEFIKKVEWYPIARDVTTHRNHFYFMSPSTHVENIMSYITLSDQPYKIAEEVNEELFDKNGAFFNQRGTYVGWVKLDGIKEKYARLIWQSNFPEDDDFLDYCNITVKSGQDPRQFPDQSYGPIVKGCSITLPECIYDYDPGVHGEFLGWEVQKSGYSEKELMHPGDTYIVDIDTTITAKWGKINYDQLQVYLDLGAGDASPGPGQELAFMCTAGEKLDMTKMNQASRDYYELDGWYNAGGVKITESTRLRQSLCDKDRNGAVVMTEPDSRGFTHQRITLTAHWTSTKTPAVIVTAPAAQNLTYNENPQELVSAGSAAGGTLVYALRTGADADSAPDAGSYSTTIPEGTDADTYYVWYHVKGDEGHFDSEPAVLEATIAKATPEVTAPEALELQVTGEAQELVSAGSTTGGTLVYALGDDEESAPSDDAFGNAIPKASARGMYYVWYKVMGDGNYNGVEAACVPATIGGHVHGLTQVGAIAATCEDDGNIAYWVCDHSDDEGDEPCGKYFADAQGTVEIKKNDVRLPALGHDWSEPTYTWASGDATVTAERVCRNDAAHFETETADTTFLVTRQPTEQQEGSGIYTAVFENEAFETQLKEVVIPKLAHVHTAGDLEQENVVLATCDAEGGYDEVVRCTSCGEVLSSEHVVINPLGHNWGAWTVDREATETDDGMQHRTCRRCGAEEQQVIPSLGHIHKPFLVREVAPGCTRSGVVAHYKCACGQLFHDPSGLDEATIEELRVPAVGHTALDNITPEKTAEVPATCTEPGSHRDVYRCEKCSQILKVVHVEVEALGHEWGEPSYTWSADNLSVTGRVECAHDAAGKHAVEETVLTAFEVKKAPTEEEEGVGAYTASFANELLAEQSREVAIPKLAHVHVAGKPVRENQVAATCTDEGSFDEVVRCTSCGEALSISHITVAALGHDWGAWEIDVEATEGHDGLMHRTCTRCGEVQTETIPALKHVHKPAFVDRVEASCTKQGIEAHYECSCGQWFADDENKTETNSAACAIPATGHMPLDKIEPEKSSEVPATCTEAGSHRDVYRCGNCGQILQVRYVKDEPLGHIWTESGDGWRAWTEGSTVHEERKCSVCGFREERSYETDHVHDYAIVPEVPATCEKAGVKEHDVCLICGHTFLYDAAIAQLKDASEAELVIPALGHDWGEPTYRWSAGGASVTATRTCGNDASHVESETAPVVVTVTKPATCTEWGQTTYTAKFTNGAFAAQSWTDSIAPSGHVPIEPVRENEVAATCEEAGSYDSVIRCGACGEELSRIAERTAPLGHDWGEGTVAEQATCEEDGMLVFTCANNPAHVRVEAIPALGHDWGAWAVTAEPTCEAPGTESRTCANDASHVETRELPALGHAWGAWTVAKEPTETDEGLERRVCANDSVHVEERAVPAKGHVHELERVAAVAATCEEAGAIEHWKCTDCWRLFADAGGTKEIGAEDVVVPALGHAWGEWAVTAEPSCEATGTESRACANDAAHVETRELPALGHAWDKGTVTKEPGCTTEGERTFTCKRDAKHVRTEAISPQGHSAGEWERVDLTPASCAESGYYYNVLRCKDCGEVLTRRLVREAAFGHDWSAPVYLWSDDGSEVFAMRICNHDDAHVETEAVQTVATEEKAPTCTEKGLTTYTATFANAAFSTQTRTLEDRGALGHAWGAWAVVKEPTETEEGLERRICANDPAHVEERAVPAKGHVHELVRVAAVAATCERDGAIEHWKCTGCGRLFADAGGTEEIGAEDVVVPALGHAWGEWAVTAEPSCGAPGTESRTCGNDAAHVETRVLPALGHAWGEWAVAKEPTQTEEGLERRICANDPAHVEERAVPAKGHVHELEQVAAVAATCEEAGASGHWRCTGCGRLFADAGGTEEIGAEDVVVPALGHAWGEWATTKEATHEAEGEETRSCSRCSETETRPIPKKDALSYRVASGDDATWVKGSNKALPFAFKRSEDDSQTFAHFLGIKIDGIDVDKSNYSAKPGSVIVTLSPAYLETLAVGEHTLMALFDDAEGASAGFQIAAQKKTTPAPSSKTPTPDTSGGKKSAPSATSTSAPNTGDALNAALVTTIGLLIFSAFALCGLTVRRRKNSDQ